MNPSEEELVHQFSQPNRRAGAFSVIVRTYQERLYWHIRKMVLSHEDANDVLHWMVSGVTHRSLPGFIGLQRMKRLLS